MKRKEKQFLELKKAFPEAKLTEDRKFVFIPSIYLPDKYNRESTPLLISLTKRNALFGFPAVYVSRKLRIKKGRRFVKSVSLDENLTETEMLRKGWVKLCWYNPPKAKNLCQLVANVIIYLELLEE